MKKEECEWPRFLVGEMGETYWQETRNGESCDPFEYHLKFKHMGPSPQPAINVHDDLLVCRYIALSLFGKSWESHIFSIYKGLVAERALLKSEEI